LLVYYILRNYYINMSSVCLCVCGHFIKNADFQEVRINVMPSSLVIFNFPLPIITIWRMREDIRWEAIRVTHYAVT